MSKFLKHPSKKSASLVDRLQDNPLLPTYIDTLPAPVFKKLVLHIGKEDAQELLRYATDLQIRELIETDAWNSQVPGTEEKFDPAKFLEWILLWQDMSSAFLTAKLVSLGSEMLALALDKYIVVVDLDEVGVSGPVDTFSQFGVMTRDEDQWELILNLLVDVWNEDPEFLEEALAYCCMRRSLFVEKTYISGNETLEQNVEGRRDHHRRKLGYISSTSAASFLTQAKVTEIDKLIIEVAYDLYTSIHIKAMRKATGSAPKRQQTPGFSSTKSDSGAGNVNLFQLKLQELDALLIQHEIVDPAPFDRLLASPNAKEDLYIKRQLRELAKQDPIALDHRQDEIIYLANLLVEGTEVQRNRINELDAIKYVLGTCNLGLEYCVFEESWGSEKEILHALLRQEPGLIKAFRIGYNLISQLPIRAAATLEQELMSAKALRKLHGYPWIEELVKKTFARPIHGRAASISSECLAVLLDALLPIGDNSICQQLRILCDSFPCYPQSLQPGENTQIYVDKRWRAIETWADLQQLYSFIKSVNGKVL